MKHRTIVFDSHETNEFGTLLFHTALGARHILDEMGIKCNENTVQALLEYSTNQMGILHASAFEAGLMLAVGAYLGWRMDSPSVEIAGAFHEDLHHLLTVNAVPYDCVSVLGRCHVTFSNVAMLMLDGRTDAQPRDLFHRFAVQEINDDGLMEVLDILMDALEEEHFPALYSVYRQGVRDLSNVPALKHQCLALLEQVETIERASLPLALDLLIKNFYYGINIAADEGTGAQLAMDVASQFENITGKTIASLSTGNLQPNPMEDLVAGATEYIRRMRENGLE